MVDSKYTISQLEPCIVSRSGYDYNHIYTSKNRLGDEPTPSVRQMVIGEHSVPYQFPGIKSSLICTDDFGQSSLWPKYSNSSRQRDSSDLPESHGRNSITHLTSMNTFATKIWERTIVRNIHLTAVHTQ